MDSELYESLMLRFRQCCLFVCGVCCGLFVTDQRLFQRDQNYFFIISKFFCARKSYFSSNTNAPLEQFIFNRAEILNSKFHTRYESVLFHGISRGRNLTILFLLRRRQLTNYYCVCLFACLEERVSKRRPQTRSHGDIGVDPILHP